jgi:hypothetical protein
LLVMIGAKEPWSSTLRHFAFGSHLRILDWISLPKVSRWQVGSVRCQWPRILRKDSLGQEDTKSRLGLYDRRGGLRQAHNIAELGWLSKSHHNSVSHADSDTL